MRHFMADDGTEMTFEMVEEIFGCQRFKIMVKDQPTRTMILVEEAAATAADTIFGKKKILSCQRFKAIALSRPTQPITLVSRGAVDHYKTLEILLAGGMHCFERLNLWNNSIERPIHK